MNKEERRRKAQEYAEFAEHFSRAQNNNDGQTPYTSAGGFQKTVLGDDVASSEEAVGAVLVTNGAEKDKTFGNLKTELFFDDLPISVAQSSVIGRRKSQQDSVIIPKNDQLTYEDKPKLICILSDGMGGLNGGELASQTVTANFFKDYYSAVWKQKDVSYIKFFSEEADKVNRQVLDLCDEDGNPLHAGATLIAVAIDNYDMHFLNVGDSRIYMIREGNILQITHDQNYLTVLMEKVENGEISIDEALSHPKKEALISYCGIKELKIKEINLKPVKMRRGDVILLASDGLYRLLSENEILEIVTTTSNDLNLAAYKLTAAATNKNHRGQDNTSVILIKFN